MIGFSRLGQLWKRTLTQTGLTAYRQWPLSAFVPMIREGSGIILTTREINAIRSAVLDKAPCNFLVFGLGNDSPLWHLTNLSGKTVFVEDNPEWRERVVSQHPELDVAMTSYSTRRSEWEEYLDATDTLRMNLPEDISTVTWDVVLVDAPAGWKPEMPGRMQSIYETVRLTRPGSDVFIHDIDRTVEDVYSKRFFGDDNHVADIDRLRHYQIT